YRDVLSALVLRIGIGAGQRLRDPDHGLLVTGVVVEDAVALLDGAKMLLRQRIPDAAPDRLLVLHERVPSVVGWFFLHQPVHGDLTRAAGIRRGIARSSRRPGGARRPGRNAH